jgi:hypothetical protein
MNKLTTIAALLGIAWVSAGALLLAATPATGPATAPASQIPLEAVEKLVAQLSSDDWKVRDKAQEQIVDLGIDACPHLERIVRRTREEEVRTRLEAALRQIAENDKTSPTLISLHFKDSPAQAIAREIAAQAKVELGAWHDSIWKQARPLTINVDRQPFWLVMKEFSEKSGLRPDIHGGRPGLTLNQGTMSAAKHFVHQCFLIVAESASRTHGVNYEKPEQINTHFSLSFKVYVDPKVRVLKGSQQLKLIEVKDENGKSLIPAAPQGEWMSGPSWGQGWMWQISTPLQWSPDIGRKIATFRASARFMIETKTDHWEIPDVLSAKDVVKEVGTVKYTVKSVTQSGANSCNVKVLITQPPGRGEQNPLTDFSTFQRAIQLLDAQGIPWQSSGGGGGGSWERLEYDLSFYASDGAINSPKPGPPVKLRWSIPTEIKTVDVPVEFQDLPIP